MPFSAQHRWLPLLSACALALSGCGATVESAGGAAAPNAAEFPITLENCGQQVTFEEPPNRVISNDIAITEMMFALGLGDRMAGYIVSAGQEGGIESSPWREEFERTPRLAESMTKEAVRAADADFVFAGWNYGFSESKGLTPASLAELDIDSYLLTESCRNGIDDQRGIMPPLDALYTDLRNLGTLFGVSDRAEALIAENESTISRSRYGSPAGERPSVFLYDSGTDQPVTSGNGGAADQIISEAGGTNIFSGMDDSWTSVGWEAVVRADPEIILINDYGEGGTVEDKIDFLTSHPALAGVEAVREERFFALPYAALVEGPRNPGAVADFAAYLRNHSR